MHWVFSAAAVLGLVAAVVQADDQGTAISSAPAPAFQWREIPNRAFAVGENLIYVIKWGGITGGRASFTVTGWVEHSSRTAYHIVSEAHSVGVVNAFYKVRDRNEIWLDRQSLSTLHFSGRIREGKYKVDRDFSVDHPAGTFRYESQRLGEEAFKVIEGTAPAHVLDPFSSLFYVRTQPMEVGRDIVIDVLDGKKVYPMVVRVHAREKVKVPAGKFDCFKVEPMLRDPGIFINKGKKVLVWLTADERRIPVRMESEVFIGSVSADLEKLTYVPPPLH